MAFTSLPNVTSEGGFDHFQNLWVFENCWNQYEFETNMTLKPTWLWNQYDFGTNLNFVNNLTMEIIAKLPATKSENPFAFTYNRFSKLFSICRPVAFVEPKSNGFRSMLIGQSKISPQALLSTSFRHLRVKLIITRYSGINQSHALTISNGKSFLSRLFLFRKCRYKEFHFRYPKKKNVVKFWAKSAAGNRRRYSSSTGFNRIKRESFSDT